MANSDAAQLARAPGSSLPFAKIRPAGNLLGARHVPGKVAGIVGLTGRGPVRHGFGLDEIAPAQGVGRDIHLAPGDINEAFDHIGGFRPAGPAIGVDRQRIGEHAAQPDVATRNVVDAGQHFRPDIGNEGRIARQIRAHVGQRIDIERKKAASFVERELGSGDVVTALGVGEKMLAALRNPFDRPAQALGGLRRKGVFPVGK